MSIYRHEANAHSDEPSFDDHFDSGVNMKLKLQQGRAAPAVKTMPASHRRAAPESANAQPYHRLPRYLQPRYLSKSTNAESFAGIRQTAEPQRRSCNDIFRNIHHLVPDQRLQIRGGKDSFGSRGGHNGGARLYGQYGQNDEVDRWDAPDAPDFGHHMQEQDAVISRAQAQAGKKPERFMGPTALRKLKQ
jgi:hypothetical protein